VYYYVQGYEQNGMLGGYSLVQLRPTQGPGLDSIRIPAIETEKYPVGSMVKVELTVLAVDLQEPRVA
jgi:hypothetical protein